MIVCMYVCLWFSVTFLKKMAKMTENPSFGERGTDCRFRCVNHPTFCVNGERFCVTRSGFCVTKPKNCVSQIGCYIPFLDILYKIHYILVIHRVRA